MNTLRQQFRRLFDGLWRNPEFMKLWGSLTITAFGAQITNLALPLTAAVLDSAPADQAGVASGVNNAVARLAGLLGVAAVPWAAGFSMTGTKADPQRLTAGFHRAMVMCAGLCLLAAVASVLWVPARPTVEKG